MPDSAGSPVTGDKADDISTDAACGTCGTVQLCGSKLFVVEIERIETSRSIDTPAP